MNKQYGYTFSSRIIFSPLKSLINKNSHKVKIVHALWFRLRSKWSLSMGRLEQDKTYCNVAILTLTVLIMIHVTESVPILTRIPTITSLQFFSIKLSSFKDEIHLFSRLFSSLSQIITITVFSKNKTQQIIVCTFFLLNP